MALVGHISGSTQSNSLIAVSGTVIIANRPDALFPLSLPGADVSFFVSGTLGGKGVAERTVSLFGGDVVVSGSLTVGSGTVKLTSNDMQFGSFGNRIELNGSDITFFDGNNLTGRTLTTLTAATAGGSDTHVQFNNAGSLAGSSTFTFASANGRATVAHVSVDTSLTASIIKAGGATVSLFDDTATTINFGAGASSALNIGPVGGVTTISGDLKISGNDIKSSDTSTAITLSSADVSVVGALTVGTTLGVTGAATLSSTLNAGASTLASLSVTGNAIISGDLTVNGTMATVNTTNLEVKDSVIGLGFSSGTIAVAAGDRGWIGGLSGVNNVMSKWDNTAAEFAFATTTSSATGSFAITAYSNLHANNIQGSIVSASLGFSGSHTKLMDGTSYIIAGSGMSVTSASNGAITLSTAGGGGDVTGPGSSTANAVALFDGATGKIIKNSGLTTDGSNSLFIAGTLGVSGSTTFGASVLPSVDMTYDLGSPSFRWANVYTGDLHLRNERGNWTVIEEESYLSIRNNHTGKMFKFVLEEVSELIEE